MKKTLVSLMLTFMALFAVTANTFAAEDAPMAYMTAEALKDTLGNKGYVVIDVRKAADYAKSHIPGAISVDMDAAVAGNTDAGLAAMKPAVEGVSDNIVLVCYSGKKYAQVSTNALAALGYDMSKVFTLQDGFNNWAKVYPDNIAK